MTTFQTASNMKSGEKKELGLYTSSAVQITEAPGKRAVLEFSCKVQPGAWIFGTDISKIKNFLMVALDLYSVDSTITSNSKILIETISVKFFTNVKKNLYLW